MRKNVKKVRKDIKHWLNLMDEKQYDAAEKINLKKIQPVLGKGALPYAPTKKEIKNPNEFLKLVSCSVQVRDDQPKSCEKEGYPREKGCYNPYAVCREALKTNPEGKHKKKATSFNICVGEAIQNDDSNISSQEKFSIAAKQCAGTKNS